MRKRWLIIAACLLLVLMRVIWPNLQIDAITLWLVGIAAVLLMLPELLPLTQKIKRIKIGENELELRDKTEQLEKETEKVQEIAGQKRELVIPPKLIFDIEEVINRAVQNPSAGLRLLYDKIEYQLFNQFGSAIMNGGPWTLSSARRAVDYGVATGQYPPALAGGFRALSQQLDAVVPSPGPEADKYALEALPLGLVILRVVYTETQPGVYSS